MMKLARKNQSTCKHVKQQEDNVQQRIAKFIDSSGHVSQNA